MFGERRGAFPLVCPTRYCMSGNLYIIYVGIGDNIRLYKVYTDASLPFMYILLNIYVKLRVCVVTG